jgi:mRNA interferase MazF
VQAVLDPVRGSEQGGLRPVLIVSNDEYNRVVSNVTALPLTSTRRTLYPSEVLLPAGVAGQPLESIILAHQIRTISRERLRRQVGFLEDPTLREAVRTVLREHLSLE